MSISVADLLEAVTRGDGLVIVDVRSAEEYDSGHVDGAIHLPADELLRAVERFDARGVRFVTVCTKGGGRSRDAAQILVDAGRDACFLDGGTLAWQAQSS